MSWDFGNNGSGDKKKTEFTKFPVGVSNIRVIDDAPIMRWVHWLNNYQRSVNCPGKNCPICEIRRQQKANSQPYTYAMGKRLAINVINRETKNQEVMEQGITFFEDLRDLMTDLKEQGKSLRDVDIKVKRRGTGKDDTSYRLDIGEEYGLSEDDHKLMLEKLDLVEYFKAHTPEQILSIIQFSGTKEEMAEHWNKVVNPESTSDTNTTDEGEDFEVR